MAWATSVWDGALLGARRFIDAWGSRAELLPSDRMVDLWWGQRSVALSVMVWLSGCGVFSRVSETLPLGGVHLQFTLDDDPPAVFKTSTHN